MAIEVPRFNLPLSYVKAQAIVNEQGSLNDIASRVYATCACEPGTVGDAEEFGLPDPTFTEPSASTISQIIEHWVPDAQILIESAPSKYDEAITNAGIKVQVRQ